MFITITVTTVSFKDVGQVEIRLWNWPSPMETAAMCSKTFFSKTWIALIHLYTIVLWMSMMSMD